VYKRAVPEIQTNERAEASSTVFIETYGCQMNVADSELISGVLSAAGYRAVAKPADADVILLNTCAIREHAEARVAQRVRQLISLHARGERRVRVGLAGCMAQHHREKLLDSIPGLDFIVGPDSYRRLPGLLEADAPATDVRLDRQETYDDIVPVRADGVRAWLTIMRGCDRFCTFCVVPYVRGRERSLPADVLVEEARQIAAAGYREIVLLGQTVNAYHDGDADFGELLRRLSTIEGIARLRFTSPHPADMAESSITAMRELEKVSPHLHLPLQSGSDRILRAMDRGHTIHAYLALVEKVRAAVPEVALSTDIIVGYPGETSTDFEATSRIMEAIGFDHAYLFKYSRRDGTRAFRLEETVTEEEKSERLDRLIVEQESRSLRINRSAIGQTTEVLAEMSAKRQVGWLSGKNPQFKTVAFEPLHAKVGELATVRIEAATSHTLSGREVPRA
jgi:tRNA-2-methylthio-N6-dimethylallyladenosine synthase